jgi:FkbM family methyltransferase
MIYSHSDSKGIPLQTKLNEIIDKRKGFFIELGANDGLTQSNTAYFEKELEWNGILIEPSLIGYNKCKVNRPNSICLNYACVSNEYKEDYILGDFQNNHLMASVNGKRLNNTNSLVKVKTITLETILDKYCNSNIDFMSLDTEGYELEILKGLNLNKYRPNFMLIEIYNHDYENIINYLKLHNYRLHSNFTNYNKIDIPVWDGTHNDYLFIDNNLSMNL